MALPAPLPRDVQSFNVEAENILGSFAASLQGQVPPPILYHYTNDVGLKGIIEAGQLWFTDIFDLNDPSELKHGYVLPSYLSQHQTSAPSSNGSMITSQQEKLLAIRFQARKFLPNARNTLQAKQ